MLVQDSVPDTAHAHRANNTIQLNTMTTFATGRFLSDMFLHLMPHLFLGELQGASMCFILMEGKRNILIRLAIFIGFAAFFIMEKSLHILGGEDEGHRHLHVHAHATEPAVGMLNAVTAPSKDGLCSHKGDDRLPALPCHHG